MDSIGYLNNVLLGPEDTLREAIRIMTAGPGTPMVLVVDGDRRLLGVVVDYDVRTALLHDSTLDSPLGEIMNTQPRWLPVSVDREELRAYFSRWRLKAVPLLDENHRVWGLARLGDYLPGPAALPNKVVIMAGGKGTRLRPLTYTKPKPMVMVGDKPILETTLCRLAEAGFADFHFSVNYRADQIKEYFGDGSAWGVSVNYLEEDRPLGTAGSLGLLDQPGNHPILVLNGDLLTKVNFRALLDFHTAGEHWATICVREHRIDVPYGVVEVAGTRMESLVEKPSYRVLVNAGIYVLQPQVIAQVPAGRRCDMTDLLESVNAEMGKPVGCFPVSEYWMDVGRVSDHRQAQQDYPEVFGDVPGFGPGAVEQGAVADNS